MSTSRSQQIQQLEQEWKSARWEGITRPYSAEDVINLRGSVNPECTLAQNGAAKLWALLNGKARKGYVNCLGALTGGQALQQAKAGVEAIYLSGWQVAADANSAAAMYPDQSLYPVDSVPKVVERINNTFRRADQIQWANQIEPGSKGYTDYFLPIVADAEAGFGGVLNAFELMKAMITAGAAGVHFEDQLAAVKKCGHMGGKVLVPTQEAIQKLVAARLAADVLGVPTLVIARTDADAADLLTSDCDPYDSAFVTGERTAEGFFRTHAGVEQAISRGLAYAPYADMVWCETSTPDLDAAQEPRRSDHRSLPAGAVGHGLQVSVHHAGGHPQHVVQHVRPGARLCTRRGDETLRREGAAGGVRRGGSRLHLRVAPAGGGHRLLRQGHHRHSGRRLFGHRADRFDGRAAVLMRQA